MRDVQWKVRILNFTQCNAKMTTLKAYYVLYNCCLVKAWNPM